MSGKRCEGKGCSTQAAYGFAGEEERRCKAHSLAGMVRACSSWYIGGLQSALILVSLMAMTSHGFNYHWSRLSLTRLRDRM